MKIESAYVPELKDVKIAAENLKGVAVVTPLNYNIRYSKQYNSKVYFKREDLQQVRSYKIRGAYNKMSSLTNEQAENGIVCASAGNHAQGVAIACKTLKIKGSIFMPSPTPNQKIEALCLIGPAAGHKARQWSHSVFRNHLL